MQADPSQDDTTATEPTPKGERSETTTYVVLYTTETDPKWAEHQRVDARSAEAAVRAAVAKKIPDGARQFVAVPSRSWRPVKVTPKVETTLVIEDA